MSLGILELDQYKIPEVLDVVPLDYGRVISFSFNRKGSLMAAGCHDGRIVIWDLVTKNVARVLIGHLKPVSSISWSRNGRKLLSSSLDWSVIRWDVLSSSIDVTERFDRPILSSQIHPTNPDIAVVCPLLSPALWIDFESGKKFLLSVPSLAEGTSSNKPQQKGTSGESPKIHTAAIFNKDGRFIFSASNSGVISATNLQQRTNKIVASTKAAAIKSMELSRDGKYLLVNSNDKLVCFSISSPCLLPSSVADHPVLTHTLDFVDAIMRLGWKHGSFSSNSEFVIGCPSDISEHKIYIWTREAGSLVKIIEGPMRGISYLAWHPLRPTIASSSNEGAIYFWNTDQSELWSSFAPDFEDLEENVECKEREEVFEEILARLNKKKNQNLVGNPQEEGEEVDILMGEKEMQMPYSDSEEDDLEYLPVIPEPDVPPPKDFFSQLDLSRERQTSL